MIYRQEQEAQNFNYFSSSYQTKLLELIYEWSSIGYNHVRFNDSGFEFDCTDFNFKAVLDIENWKEVQYEIETVEYHLNMAKEEIEEANRLYLSKQAALSKLTAEEKKILGLN